MEPYQFDMEAHRRPERVWFKQLRTTDDKTRHPRVVTDYLGPLDERDLRAAEEMEETFRRTEKFDTTFQDEERFLGLDTREDRKGRKNRPRGDGDDMDTSAGSSQVAKRRKLEKELGFSFTVDETMFDKYV